MQASLLCLDPICLTNSDSIPSVHHLHLILPLPCCPSAQVDLLARGFHAEVTAFRLSISSHHDSVLRQRLLEQWYTNLRFRLYYWAPLERRHDKRRAHVSRLIIARLNGTSLETRPVFPVIRQMILKHRAPFKDDSRLSTFTLFLPCLHRLRSHWEGSRRG